MTADLRIIPIGGLGEFGLNSLLLETGEDRLLIDAGQLFPEWENGVSRIVPDYRRLGAGRLHGILLTHGHEDHIGSLAQALEWQEAPVFGSAFTLALAQRGLLEAGHEADLRRIEDTTDGAEPLRLGPFEIHAIPVAHSTPGSLAFVIAVPSVGVRVMHTGDFKLASDAPPAERTDLGRFAAWGARGVDVLLSDSTGAESAGRTKHEDAVVPAFEKVIDAARGRVIATCFASSIPRIERVARVGAGFGRKVAFAGRRLWENVSVARDLGLMLLPDGDSVAPLEDTREMDGSRLLIFAAGSQAEPRSAMSQIANGEHPFVRVTPGDVVVFSSRIIPGRDRIVSRLMGRLIRQGASVVHGGTAHVHVSGHAAADELCEVLAAVKPRAFVPVHGEVRMLAAHARLADQALGNEAPRTFVLSDGDVLRVSETAGARVDGRVEVPRRHLGAPFLTDLGDDLLSERFRLSTGGFVVPVIYVDREGREARPCELVTRGFVERSPIATPVIDEIRETVRGAVEASRQSRLPDHALRDSIEADLNRLLRRRFEIRPIVAPIIVTVDA